MPATPRIIGHAVRPEQTAVRVAVTGLDEAALAGLVDRFYARVREDALLGPVFAARVHDWRPHLERMCAFWSSVVLVSGRYHGAPVPAHVCLPIGAEHFERWLSLFRQTARETCAPAGAVLVIEKAERIARSLRGAIAAADDVPPHPC